MKKIIAIITVCLLAFSQMAFAADFADMPDNWATASLQAAVDNGLLTGSGGYIYPDNNMTRAEMATIMARACAASAEADISAFTDVKSDDWFYSSMAKAVAMGAFTGADNMLNPNDPITRQEAFVVLARVFSLNLDKNIDTTILNDYKDGAAVASWAKEAVAAIISNGYVTGADGYLNPESNISRAEFAAVMNRLVSYYVDDSSVSTVPSDGNVMVRVGGITLDGIKSDKMLVLGDGIGKAEVKIINADLSGKVVIRGGETVTAAGKFGELRVVQPNITLECGSAEAKRIYCCRDSVVDIGTILATDNGETVDDKTEADGAETEKQAENEAEGEEEK